MPAELLTLMQIDFDKSFGRVLRKSQGKEMKHLEQCYDCEIVVSENQRQKFERQAFETRREMELSTELKTASFFYDFHISSIYQQIINDDVRLNLSYLLSHLLVSHY